MSEKAYTIVSNETGVIMAESFNETLPLITFALRDIETIQSLGEKHPEWCVINEHKRIKIPYGEMVNLWIKFREEGRLV